MDCNATIVFQLYAAQQARPVEGAQVALTDRATGATRMLTANSSGRTPVVCAEAPDRALSLDPAYPGVPYSLYDAEITAAGYTPARVEGIQVFAGERAVQELELSPAVTGRSGETPAADVYPIPENALLSTEARRPEGPGADARILTEVYIPKYITVHLGTPNNAAAANVTVRFVDYIKNVASSEIYPTWPGSALRANIIAQISFALNRIFTEWYPSRGYSFNITNNTGYDQAYVHGRNIFANISELVDAIFNQYIRRQGSQNPLFASYCNGTTVTCGGMSQWGTVPLAEQGYTPINILRYYYGAEYRAGVRQRHAGAGILLSGHAAAAGQHRRCGADHRNAAQPHPPQLSLHPGDYDGGPQLYGGNAGGGARLPKHLQSDGGRRGGTRHLE